MSLNISLPHNRLSEFCQRHRIVKLSLFGSVLRDDFRSDSDVDILVEFEPAHTPGLISLARMELELFAGFDMYDYAALIVPTRVHVR